jgi:hypothetical protein
MRAVYEDLKVDEFRTGVRALGLIDKIVTGLLWRVLNVKEHAVGMNGRYERIMVYFEQWSEDASSVAVGEARMYDDVHVETDEMFDCLVKQRVFREQNYVVYMYILVMAMSQLHYLSYWNTYSEQTLTFSARSNQLILIIMKICSLV